MSKHLSKMILNIFKYHFSWLFNIILAISFLFPSSSFSLCSCLQENSQYCPHVTGLKYRRAETFNPPFYNYWVTLSNSRYQYYNCIFTKYSDAELLLEIVWSLKRPSVQSRKTIKFYLKKNIAKSWNKHIFLKVVTTNVITVQQKFDIAASY